MKKVFFFDVDGTIMYRKDNENCIPKGLKEEIIRLKNKGYGLFIASGRPKSFISDRLLDLGFNGFVLCNGSHVEVNGEMIYEQTIGYDHVKKLVEFLDTKECEYDFETSTYSYIDKKFVDFTNFFKGADIQEEQLVHDFDIDEAYNKALKIEISTSKDHQDILDYIKDKFKYDSHGTANSFEICNPHISKAIGVKKVLEHFNIDLNNSYAFGDGLNDLEMIEAVGHGIAMGNAMQELKDVANEVIGNVEDDALVTYLKTID